MVRALWTGSLSFGLVNVPVQLVSAVRDLDLHFRQLHAKDNVPVETQRWCSEEEKEVPYEAITHSYEDRDFARRIFERVQEARHQQDNEQWHLLILEEWIHRQHIPEMFFLHRIVPQAIAFLYYQISWLLYVIKPSWSYRLNVEFEDHAEREYMLFAREHPELESEPFESDFKKDYGDFPMMADVIRQIGYDERMHKEESMMKMGMARFA